MNRTDMKQVLISSLPPQSRIVDTAAAIMVFMNSEEWAQFLVDSLQYMQRIHSTRRHSIVRIPVDEADMTYQTK